MINLIITAETHVSEFGKNMSLFFMLIIAIILIGIIITKRNHDEKFGKWFQEVLEVARQSEVPQAQIDDFEEIFWWDYFCQDMTPKEALDFHLKNM